ncbi:MAG: S8 family serine peptidase [Planctomycetes bacterium]|nr:S8 family serine peptidase [Planctomycetota bacterium]MCB9917546.1 S8 family serine peptidase [Planctomycetota bacterium]
MNPRASIRWSALRRGLPVLFFGCFTFSSDGLIAQRKAATPVAPTNESQQSPFDPTRGVEIEGKPSMVVEAEGDEPDFRPYEEVDAPEGSNREASMRPVGDPYVLSFPAGQYAPAPGVDARLRTLKSETAYGYVMVEGQMNKAGRRAALEALGCEILGVQTWQSWVVRFPRANADRIAALDFVRWVGMAQNEFKVEPELASVLANAAEGELIDVDISTFVTDIGDATERKSAKRPTSAVTDAPMEELVVNIVPNGPFHKALVDAGMRFGSYTDIDNVHVFHGKITKSDLAKILDLPFVSFVEKRVTHTRAHDQSMAMTHQDLLRKTYGGRGISVGVIDSGYYYQHRDLSLLAVGWDTVGTGVYNDENGHGTHVAGTMIGRGIADKRYVGGLPTTATDGTDRIFVGRYLNKAGSGVGTVSTLYNALRSSYTSGGLTSQPPVAINNSWGAYRSTGYNGADSSSRTVDAYIWSYNQTYVFAAGNEGSTAKARTPGVAKNVVTVGGTDDTWRSGRNPGDFYTNSSGGGTADNRNKPEILAPGTLVTSCRAGTTSSYSNFTGTSMATPHITAAAGAVADRSSFFSYKPHSMKSMLVASTEYRGYPGTSSGWFGTRAGYGQLDARKLPGSAKSGWFSYAGGTSSTNGAVWSTVVTMPSTIENLKFIGTWIEPAAASTATKARVNDVRFVFDVAPFSTIPSTPGTGDISLSSSEETVLSFARGGSAAQALRGKQVKVWIWGRTISSSVRPAWTCILDYDVPTNTSTLSISAPTRIKPNTNFTTSVTLSTPTNVADFDNARIWLTASGFTFVDMRRTMLDGILQTYSGTAFPSYPYPSLTGGMTVGAGDARTLSWTLRSPATSNTYTLTGHSISDPTLSRTASRTICVDGLAPAKIANLRSTSHSPSTWSNATTLRMAWNAATDNGCAGMWGIATRLSLTSAQTPTTRNLGNVTAQNVAVSSNTAPYYFTARGVDNLSNFSASSAVAGPYYVDATNPVLSTVQINNGASATNSLGATVRLTASDAHSGVYQVRFSSNGSTWSPWRAVASSYSFNMSTYGGNTSQGTKYVYAQVRDKALNVSGTVRDSIVYDSLPPNVTLVQIASGAAYTSTLASNVRVNGSGGPTQMRFSSNGSTWSPWQAFSTSAIAYNLSSYGGNTSFGTKTVYAQLRDAVGNQSASSSDTIVYMGVPTLGSASPSALRVVNKQAVRLTGNNLSAIEAVFFGATKITSVDSQDWAQGYFRKVSNTAIDLYCPQGENPGTYQVYVANAVGASSKLPITISHNTTPFAGSPSRSQRGRNLEVLIHRGNRPGTTISILTVSASGTPLNIPGIVNLGHGGNASTIIDPSLLVLAVGAHDPTSRAARFDVPMATTLPAIRLYFESLLLDTLNPGARPIPSSGATSTQLF